VIAGLLAALLAVLSLSVGFAVGYAWHSTKDQLRYVRDAIEDRIKPSPKTRIIGTDGVEEVDDELDEWKDIL